MKFLRWHRAVGPGALGAAWWLLAILLAAGSCAPGEGGSGSSDDDDSLASGPVDLFDAHIHLNPGESGTAFLEMTQGAGLLGVVTLGPRDAVGLAAAYPDYVVPFAFLSPHEPVENFVELASGGLAAGGRGIGELSIRHFPAGTSPDGVYLEADRPELLAVYELAASEGVPVTVHLDYEAGQMQAFETALDHAPGATFIWAHSGDAQPEAIRPLLEAHDNLWADLSARNPFYLPRSDFTEEQMSIAELDRVTLREDWRLLLQDHSDRFVFGTDIGPGDRDQQIGEVVPWYQAMLGQLDRAAAEAIGHGNAQRLFGLQGSGNE